MGNCSSTQDRQCTGARAPARPASQSLPVTPKLHTDNAKKDAKLKTMAAEIAKLKAEAENAEHLHWNPKFGDRRGLGDAIVKVNHVAIIVSDVGRAVTFYSDVLGLQQVRRPNFDRHGAWFTMGNCELHLIKGNPVVASGDDLIVGHISLEVDPELIESGKIAERLKELGVEFRQNVSVPDPKKSRENKFEGASTSDGDGGPAKPTTGVVQYFFRDPDGYWIEICNCSKLTAFVMGEDDDDKHGVAGYKEGADAVATTFKVGMAALHWKKWGHKKAVKQDDQILHDELKRADKVDPEKLQNLIRRRNTYGDVTQGHSDEELEAALLEANNEVAVALELLKQAAGDHAVFQPPAWIEDGKVVKGKAFESPHGSPQASKQPTEMTPAAAAIRIQSIQRGRLARRQGANEPARANEPYN